MLSSPVLADSSVAECFIDESKLFDTFEQRTDHGPCPWWDLLALQIPGGGFGPIEDFLALLGLVDGNGQLVSRIAKDSFLCMLVEGALATDQEHVLTAALGIAWLESTWSAEASPWEPLVQESKRLAAGVLGSSLKTVLGALEWARAIMK
ncbi:MAG: hypothetical protein N3A02_03290 [Rectinema sp.]|nr:hypothetical protein [Rectinema sp.]